ncbi:ABC transporter ATP-binding protein [Schaalia sp. 19OD2882]|uniref:ABC transporter ATP-binding protein n=1 Tax=Schaalia sp. 19OD2882 TaxID=2794089 RepID=UPI001C1EAD0A|nr:ABC transporter ATP-binding protein [Schaalia sp. 19OD2882]QWW20708.1 ABC transporter ATP-binding protein [Schaalia sp. 19OD2882]
MVGPDVRPQMLLVVTGIIVLLLEVVFRVLEPWPMKIAIDSVLSPGATGIGIGSSPAVDLAACAAMLLLTVVMRALSNYVATVCFAVAGSRVAASLRARVFHHVQCLSQQFHSHNRSADTVQRIVSDVARMQDVAVTAGLPLLANGATLLVMLAVMLVLEPVLALVVLAAMVVFVLVSRGSSRKITAASRRTRQGEGRLADAAQETLSSIRVIQAYGLEPMVEQRFARTNTHSLLQGVRAVRMAAGLERSTDVIVGLVSASVLVGGGIGVLAGSMTVGELVLFASYLRTAMKPLRDMAKYTGRIARANASGERVADLFDMRPDIVSPPRPRPLGRVHGALELQHVTTHYADTEVLHGLDLRVAPGEFVAIVGPSGAGKSTLVSLVTRSMDPTCGQVLLDGIPLTDLDLAQLRGAVSVLHQDAVLFAGTIRENIRLGRPGATDAEVEAAARAAHAHGFTVELAQGYDTVVGERGGTLSGGQRQRIAIARALLRDSPVVILDEATTGLDHESAEQVLDAIRELVRGRTTLAVTHDAQVAIRASRVVWMDRGRILMDAPPQQLLAGSSLFRDWVAAGDRALSPAEVRRGR